MKRNKLRRIAFSVTPVLYVVAIVFLVYKYFSNTVYVTDSVGSITLSAAKTPANRLVSERFRSVTVSGGGSVYNFGWQHPLVLRTGDDVRHKLRILSYETSGDELHINFDYNVQLIFKENGGGITVKAVVPAIRFGIKSLSLPWNAAKDFEVRYEQGQYLIARDDDVYHMEYAGGTIVNPQKKRIEFTDFPNAEVRFTQNSFGEARSIDDYIAELDSSFSSDAFMTLLETVRERALTLLRGRFNADAGTYRLNDGRELFKESAALLHAMLILQNTDEWEQLFRAAAQHKAQLTLKSAAYFGNIEAVGQRSDADTEELLEKIREAVDSEDTSIFLKDHLFDFVVINREYGLRTRLGELASVVDNGEPSLITAGKLLYLLDAINDERRVAEVRAANAQVASLITRIVWLDRGLLMYTDGTLEIKGSLRSGYALMSAANNRSLGRYNARREEHIGEKLIETALSFADSEGYMPVSIAWQGSSPQYSRERFTYEDVAGWLWPEADIPVSYSQHKVMGAGGYLYTLVNSPSISYVNRRVINVELPGSYSGHHYIILGGVGNIAGVNLNNAEDLEKVGSNLDSVSEGWVYDSKGERLYIKLRSSGLQQNLFIVVETAVEAPRAAGGSATAARPAVRSSSPAVAAAPEKELSQAELNKLKKEEERRKKEEEKRRRDEERRNRNR
jgi:hypothetical protein